MLNRSSATEQFLKATSNSLPVFCLERYFCAYLSNFLIKVTDFHSEIQKHLRKNRLFDGIIFFSLEGKMF